MQHLFEGIIIGGLGLLASFILALIIGYIIGKGNPCD